MAEDNSKAQKDLETTVKTIQLEMDGFKNALKSGKDQVSSGFNEIFGGGGPFSILAEEVKNIGKKFNAFKDILVGTTKMFLSPFGAFKTKEEKQLKKTQQATEENTGAEIENTDAVEKLTKEVKKLNKRVGDDDGLFGGDDNDGGGRNALLTGFLFTNTISRFASSLTNIVPTLPIVIAGGVAIALSKIRDYLGLKGDTGIFSEEFKLNTKELWDSFQNQKFFTPEGKLKVKGDVLGYELSDETQKMIEDGIITFDEIMELSSSSKSNVNSNQGGNFYKFEDRFKAGDYTGSGLLSGGIDGKGGMPEIVHPNELILDQSNKNKYPYVDPVTMRVVDPNNPDSVRANESLRSILEFGGPDNKSLEKSFQRYNFLLAQEDIIKSPRFSLYPEANNPNRRLQTPSFFGEFLPTGLQQSALTNALGLDVSAENIDNEFLKFIPNVLEEATSATALSNVLRQYSTRVLTLSTSSPGDLRSLIGTYTPGGSKLDKIFGTNLFGRDLRISDMNDNLMKFSKEFAEEIGDPSLAGKKFSFTKTKGTPPFGVTTSGLPLKEATPDSLTFYTKDKRRFRSPIAQNFFRGLGFITTGALSIDEIRSVLTTDTLQKNQKIELINLAVEEGIMGRGTGDRMIEFVNAYHNKTVFGQSLQQLGNLSASALAYKFVARSPTTVKYEPLKPFKFKTKDLLRPKKIVGNFAEFAMGNAYAILKNIGLRGAAALTASAVAFGLSDAGISFLKEMNNERRIKKLFDMTQEEFDQLTQFLQMAGVFDNDEDLLLFFGEIRSMRLGMERDTELYKKSEQALSSSYQLYPPMFDEKGKLSFDTKNTLPLIMSKDVFSSQKNIPDALPRTFLLQGPDGQQTIYSNGRMFTIEQLPDINENLIYNPRENLPPNLMLQRDLDTRGGITAGYNEPNNFIAAPVEMNLQNTKVAIDPYKNTHQHFYNSLQPRMNLQN